ncbi:hypothetical protein [Amycolatopsis regifaucium]|uniref:Uncharacterized protein n=1 Tax=Amycolatopsis regifaucium TaxID=546365 RepID=A0A154MQW7_9PSEU|nr:hypothetical protein [Amycolatopsis regifaucium]KZB86323.1 hypothetical protein AVL48_29110 [Amycolatopsis regifaucium]OKA05215.1 hypothetical protein ATP06_0229210 [Amycolatopsis regifaucium]SFH82814.1 hypothetical protein SAMN04489731_106400 [Amycolatopsis regifaucium]
MAEQAGGPETPERLPLFHDDPKLRRRRGCSGIVGVVIFAAAFGGITGLIGGEVAGLIVAGVIALPLLYVMFYNLRRRVWLEGDTLIVRTWGLRRIALTEAERIDLVISDVRGTRTVSLLVNAGVRRKVAKVDLAVYSGAGGRELGVLQLRRLANALLNNTDANGLVFSELLVAQLKSEARGDAAAERPLYRLASAAPAGKYIQRFAMEAVSRFVATLE